MFKLVDEEVAKDLAFAHNELPPDIEAFTSMLNREFNINLNGRYLDQFDEKIKEFSRPPNQKLIPKERDIDVTMFLILNYSLMTPKNNNNYKK